MSDTNKKGKVDWSKIDGSSPKPKRLHLEKEEETDSLYHCPIQTCDHDGFNSQRGCRKHVNTKHSWFFFFDEKPDVSSTKELADDDTSGNAFVFSFQPNWRLIQEMVDWKWWGLQERSCSSADSQEMLLISQILLRR